MALPTVARSLAALAERYAADGRAADAEPLYQRALAIQETALGVAHPETRGTLAAYSGILRKLGRASEASALEEGLWPAVEAAAGADANAVVVEAVRDEGAQEAVSRLGRQGDAYADAGRDTEAAVFYRRALAVADGTPVTGSSDLAFVFEHYARLLHRSNREAEAVELEKRAKEILEPADSSQPAEAANEPTPERTATR